MCVCVCEIDCVCESERENTFQLMFLVFCCKWLLHILMPDDRGRGHSHDSGR